MSALVYFGRSGKLRPGYRVATFEERFVLNRPGTCWLVRDWGDKAMACPHLQWKDGFCQEHHPDHQDEEAEAAVTAEANARFAAELMKDGDKRKPS